MKTESLHPSYLGRRVKSKCLNTQVHCKIYRKQQSIMGKRNEIVEA